MTNNEMRTAIAEHLGAQRYGLRRHGLWYRTGAGGYTSNSKEAWALPLEKAKKHERLKGSADEHVTVEPLPTPDYPDDLNAMHEAEMFLLQSEPLKWGTYKNELWKMFCSSPGQWLEKATGQLFGDDILHATARQRAEAFLRAVGKWKGEGKQ